MATRPAEWYWKRDYEKEIKTPTSFPSALRMNVSALKMKNLKTFERFKSIFDKYPESSIQNTIYLLKSATIYDLNHRQLTGSGAVSRGTSKHLKEVL